MFWISTASLVIIFFSFRAYHNNNQRWQNRKFPKSFSRIYFFTLQGLNILLIISGVLFFMLAIVCYVKGFQIQFSSNFTYNMKILTTAQ